MIPVLYSASERDFLSMGICVLSDCASVRVKRVLNGKDELEMQYPLTGVYFKELKNTRQILAIPEHKKKPQVYRIYQVRKPINGIVTVNARHVSERKAFDIVTPFSCNTLQEGLVQVRHNIYDGGAPWEFYTNVHDVNKKFVLNAPASLGSVLASLHETYGGEFEFDMYRVNILRHRGTGEYPNSDTVQILYGKNLTSLDAVESVDERVVTGICPIWVGREDEFVHLEEYVVNSQYAKLYPFDRVAVVNFTGTFEEKPTASMLKEAAVQYMQDNNIGLPIVSLKVSFVNLAQTQEYSHLASLESVNLGDAIFVRHADLDVDVTARVTETDFDVLNEKYISVTVGQVVPNISSALMTSTQNVDDKVKSAENAMNNAVSQVINTITGGDGGNIVTVYDEDEHPIEFYIMDSKDASTAVNVMRFCENGFEVSNNGINGPYHTIWRIDDFVYIRKGAVHITTEYDGDDVIKVSYGRTDCSMSNGNIILSQKNAADEVVKSIEISLQDLRVIVKDALAGYAIVGSGALEIYDENDRKEAELSNIGTWFWPDSSAPAKKVVYPSNGWANSISESSETVGTSWTKSAKSHTVQSDADGWYMVEASADGVNGIAIGVKPSGGSGIKLLGMTESGMTDIASETINTLSATCSVLCSAGDIINMFVKADSAGQISTALKVHGPLP